MRTHKLLTAVSLGIALSATAQAQFSVSGAGASVPASGLGGGMWPMGMPVEPGVSTVAVPEAVTFISSLVIEGFQHDWGGDVHATLTDPSGVEHNLFLRPGFMNPVGADFGTPGDFLFGNYTIVESGGAALPTLSDGANISPGTYNQTFSTGGTTWVSGTNGIVNTPLGSITGPQGTWTLRIYDWGAGDNGSFTGWTLNGNDQGSENTGAPACDGSAGDCPCAISGAVNQGCPNSNPNGLGAALVGTGNAAITSDTFSLSVTHGAFDKPGLVLSGKVDLSPGVSTISDSAGLLCVGGQTQRGQVVFTNGSGAASLPDFQGAAYGQAGNVSAGTLSTYQYWYRDPNTACAPNDTAGADFNFSNSWTVVWQP
jgi:hypothetical protein